MEENSKKTLILVLILFLIGIGLVFVGVIAGGSDAVKTLVEDEPETGIGKYIHFSTDGFWIGSKSDKKDTNEKGQQGKNIVSGSVIASIKDVDKIKMNLSAGEFAIQEASSDEITVDIEGKMKVKTEVKDGKLTIQTRKKKKIGFWNGISAGSMTVYLPKSQYKEIELELGAGEIKLQSGLEAEKMTLHVGAGELEAEDITAGKLDAEIGAGSFHMENVTADEMNMDVGMGECKISQADIKDIKLAVGMGAAEISIPSKEENVSYKAQCGMGELVVGSRKIDGNKNVKEKASQEEKYILDLDCGMGELHVDFEK